MKIIKSIIPNESDEFNNKSLLSNSMNEFGKQFGNVGESSFDPFSLQSSQIFPAGTVRMFGVLFTGSRQTNIIIGKHIFRFITGISGISHDFTSCRKIQRHLSDSIRVVFVSGCESVFNGDTINGYDNMHFKPIEIISPGGIVTTIFPAFDDTASGNTDVVANGCRKTVNTVCMTYIQGFDGFPVWKKSSASSYPVLCILRLNRLLLNIRGIKPAERTKLRAVSIFPPKYIAAVRITVETSASLALRFFCSLCPILFNISSKNVYIATVLLPWSIRVYVC